MSEANVLAVFSWEHDLLGNVTQQEETWPGETTRAGELRRTTMGYDDNNRLTTETIATITSSGEDTVTTAYTYDNANNRKTKTVTGGTEPGHWDYTYNHVNQLYLWEYQGPQEGDWKSVILRYDAAGNRSQQEVTTFDNSTYSYRQRSTSYTWDAQDRLSSVTLPDTIEAGVFTPGRRFRYDYDYRTRRVGTVEQSLDSSEQKRTAIVFSGGLSVAEYERTTMDWDPTLIASEASSLAVEYTRGPDMGGGVGGLLYSSRSTIKSQPSTLRYNLSNGRGDIVAQSDAYAALTWTASYEAYGKRTQETGENKDKQRGNSKDEDPTGLLNEGFRYRDIETGVWLSRDPAGFVDGPNLYAYVKQNPWSAFDPLGLDAYATADATNPKNVIVKITLPIVYDTTPSAEIKDDPKAIAAEQKTFQKRINACNKAIEKTYSGKFGKYDVETKVVSPSNGEGNTIRMSSEKSNGGQNWSWTRSLPLVWDTGVFKEQDDLVAEGQTASHEAGHLMGLGDQYDEWYEVKDGKKIRHSTPRKNFEKNIMGTIVGKPSEDDITQIIDKARKPPAEPTKSAKAEQTKKQPSKRK
jgi:RHS repeat-associated protein